MTKINIGSRVTLAEHRRDSAAVLTIGQHGTVREVLNHTFGVEWDGLDKGHPGTGPDTKSKAHWYVSKQSVEVLAKPLKDLQPMTQKVLEHLISVGTISGIEAIGMYKVRSLTKQISMIRDAGWPITSEWKEDATGQRYKRYYLSTAAVAA